MKIFQPLIASALLLAAMGLPASAQTGRAVDGPTRGGAIIETQPNTTGNDPDVVVSRGATGADTSTSDSAAGGNSNLPERAVPNGSAGGGR